MSARNGMDILVVGGGRLGTVLGSLMASKGRRVVLWVRRDELAEEINTKHTNNVYLPDIKLAPELKASTDLAGSLRETPVVMMSIPSQSFREVARTVGDTLEGDQIVVHTTKGFELSTFKRMSQILREETCTLKLGVLSGPTIAEEIAAGHPTGAILASRYTTVLETVQALFEGSAFRVYGGRDVVGAEVAGAFKNVIAVAAGAVDGLNFGDNTKWLIVSRGLNEMARLGMAMGADTMTFGGLAGIGDMAATCTSSYSLSHKIGLRLAKKQEDIETILADLPNTAEAVPTSAAIHQNATKLGLDLPIVRAVHGLLHKGWSVQKAIVELMAVPVDRELAVI